MSNVPNLITLSRLVVLLLMVWLAWARWPGAATLAFFCILYGAISDFLDGYLARKYGAISNFGKILDAVTDKFMVIGSLIILLLLGILPGHWLVYLSVVVIVVRELGITGLRMVAARHGVILAAERAGKQKTIWQITAICVLFAVPMFQRDFALWLGDPLHTFVDYVMLNGMFYYILAVWLTIQSGTFYLKRYGWVLRPSAVAPAA
jgi:CDP-diacylglycerol---glycerol-3-phosphate 3-phosphatidyltransferase